ncbi:MAG: DUF4326 domain-containing protein [Porticoccaceae bacterium]
MNTLLILYPALFSCQSKFVRKLERITHNLTSFAVVHKGDPREFIVDLFEDDGRVLDINEIEDLDAAPITHAVVFDDGEEFAEARAWLAEQAIPMRWIKISITRIVNIKRNPEYQRAPNSSTYEYIGRGSYWGNPHSMYEEGEPREEVIRKYRYDFEHNKFINIDPSRVHELAGKRLGCFCAPASCHGDVLAEFLNGFDDGK